MPEQSPEATAPDVAGKFYRLPDHYEVGREKVREYARAVQNSHPAHISELHAAKLGFDGVIAPPTFASAIGFHPTRALFETVFEDFDISLVLQVEQIFELYQPLVAGDRVHAQIEIPSIRNVRGSDFVTVKVSFIGTDGVVRQSATVQLVARSGELPPEVLSMIEGVVMHLTPDETAGLVEIDPADAAAPRELADARANTVVNTRPRFEDLSVGDELPIGIRSVTRGDLVNYAGVSGDHNPIHFSDRAAEVAGLPTVVAHGMLTLGLAADFLSSWLDDPSAIESLSFRFSGFVPVQQIGATEIEFTGKVKSLDPVRRTAQILLSGTSEGKKLFGRALAQVQLS
ncbi:fused (3R)-hydroxyacyl-ACP dehydratase subunits HadA/HadB [Nocardia stercoris]|uniref:(R)-hydratase n=1 Tax=Nocardia stercoris TaxID=2483361 RepID=A0A3M2KUC8_9NOCA|nr:fused (3R)-hydroxyacyl-ACP dehydratase subunits HadA/HadB [Nocardia stercoris]RMI28731.1 (R)-hydratase [Nocardia stercoris]